MNHSISAKDPGVFLAQFLLFTSGKRSGLRPNWNDGMMELRNNGFWGIEGMGYLENQGDKP
jgi:hypothetical protein